MKNTDVAFVSSHALALQKFTSALNDLETMFPPAELVQLAQNFILAVNPPLPVGDQANNRGAVQIIKAKMEAIKGLLELRIFNDRTGQDQLMWLLFSQVTQTRLAGERRAPP